MVTFNNSNQPSAPSLFKVVSNISIDINNNNAKSYPNQYPEFV